MGCYNVIFKWLLGPPYNNLRLLNESEDLLLSMAAAINEELLMFFRLKT